MRAAISAVLLAVTLGVAVLAGAQAPTREANELGRVMILEYHKIDTPEARWTRTPENFRRDLQRLITSAGVSGTCGVMAFVGIIPVGQKLTISSG